MPITTPLLKNPPKVQATLAKVGLSERFPLDSRLRDYPVLKARVREVLILGRQHIERELMRMRYHTGLLINVHIRLNEGRAAYGAQALSKLAKDLDIDESELGRYAQFAASYPISGDRRKLEFNLPWMHYRKLMIIKDDAQRWELTLEAEKKGWTFEEVEARVRYAIGKEREDEEPSRLPIVCLGPFFTYKIIRARNLHSRSEANELLLDLGFKHRLEMSLFPRTRFPEGTIVTAREESFSLAKAEGADDTSLYTYKARVEEVVDGDTLKVDFLLGFGNRKGETIRLNGIDCPEITTPEGKAAKRFVESELAASEFITVKSTLTRKEKWGRYLGDIFYARKGKGSLIYLNQLLLDQGHALLLRMYGLNSSQLTKPTCPQGSPPFFTN